MRVTRGRPRGKARVSLWGRGAGGRGSGSGPRPVRSVTSLSSPHVECWSDQSYKDGEAALVSLFHLARFYSSLSTVVLFVWWNSVPSKPTPGRKGKPEQNVLDSCSCGGPRGPPLSLLPGTQQPRNNFQRAHPGELWCPALELIPFLQMVWKEGARAMEDRVSLNKNRKSWKAVFVRFLVKCNHKWNEKALLLFC